MEDLDQLMNLLGYTFQNKDLLRLALIHPSLLHENEPIPRNNQRLEFLGDAVLQLTLTSELYEKHPDMGEGPLTKARAHMVNGHSLASLGRRLNLGDRLHMSRGEASNGGRQRISCVADAFEAVLGAIFLDGGYDTARQFVLRQFADALKQVSTQAVDDNPKGQLQETLQAQSPEAPIYELLSTSGPDHDRIFESRVCHLGAELGRGTGKNKKEAECQAARLALKTLQESKTSEAPVKNTPAPCPPQQPPND
jgi:ribonuclease-3